jgi:ABC-2 type transport system permease protein
VIGVVAAHVKVGLVDLARIPAFAIPTLLFPVGTYFFVANGAYGEDIDARFAMAGVAGIAVLGVSFFQVGIGIANERLHSWARSLRTLPIAPRLRLAARVLAALPVAAVSAALVIAAAVATEGVSLDARHWLALAAALLLGGIPFALAGIALGYWLPPRGAIPIANIVFLASAFAGGLWSGPADPADDRGQLASLVPTQRWGELLWASVDGRPWAAADLAVLALYGVLFGLIAAWGYRRDEGEKFT